MLLMNIKLIFLKLIIIHTTNAEEDYKKVIEKERNVKLKGEDDLNDVFNVNVVYKTKEKYGLITTERVPLCDGKYFAKYCKENSRVEANYYTFCKAVGTFFEEYINMQMKLDPTKYNFSKAFEVIYSKAADSKTEDKTVQYPEVIESFNEFTDILFSKFKTAINQHPVIDNIENSAAYIPKLLDSFDAFALSVHKGNFKSWMHISRHTQKLIKSLLYINKNYSIDGFEKIITDFFSKMVEVDAFFQRQILEYKALMSFSSSGKEESLLKQKKLLDKANLFLQLIAKDFEELYENFVTSLLDNGYKLEDLSFYTALNNYSAIVYIFKTLASLKYKIGADNRFYIFDDFLENLSLAFTHVFVSYLDLKIPIIIEQKDNLPEFKPGNWKPMEMLKTTKNFRNFCLEKNIQKEVEMVILKNLVLRIMKRKIRNSLIQQISAFSLRGIDILGITKKYKQFYDFILPPNIDEPFPENTFKFFVDFVFDGLEKKKTQQIAIFKIFDDYFSELQQQYEDNKTNLVPLFQLSTFGECIDKIKKIAGVTPDFNSKGIEQQERRSKLQEQKIFCKANMCIVVISLLILDAFLIIILLIKMKVFSKKLFNFNRATTVNKKKANEMLENPDLIAAN
ncbi:hypothetical protein GINT2_000810 [Glugoides intestinalis]